jgi:hypothetical protein
MNQRMPAGGSRPEVDAAGHPPGKFSAAIHLFLDILGISRGLTTGLLVALCLVLAVAGFIFFWSAPPRTIIITTGPEGSIFHTNALRYARILATNGIKTRILTSHGSLENLQRLIDPKGKAEVGFVVGGVTNVGMDKLVSLGSVSYQPLMIFYRGASIDILSALAGKRLAIGPEGSGTRALALKLLEANGIKPGENTALLDWDAAQSAKALLDGSADAVFLMGEDAPVSLLRDLLRAPNIHLLSFKQAVAYTRRIPYLNVLELPEGSIDLGKNIPTNDIFLVGPTVELVARETLHPALSDALLDVARKVHGNASILQRKNEFPAPLEHDFRISTDAARYYKSGKMLFYRYLPFWLAALISHIVVVFIPVLLVLIPVVRSAPRIYTWRVRSRIYRWYRALLVLEREWVADLGATRSAELLRRLDEIERAVNKLKVPAFAADLYYDLRVHITFVRQLMNYDSTQTTTTRKSALLS